MLSTMKVVPIQMSEDKAIEKGTRRKYDTLHQILTSSYIPTMMKGVEVLLDVYV